jgi:hypothetical protein
MNNKSKTAKRWLSILMVFCLVFTYSGVAAFAGTISDGYEITKGVQGEMTRPATLKEGQIWTEKIMIYDEDNLEFTVTLFAWGAQFQDKDGKWIDPLVPGTSITITDTLGDFEIKGSLPSGITDNGDGTVTWTIGQDVILGDGTSISYVVSLKDGWKEKITYRTGEAESVFEPVEGNPYYCS